MVSTQVDTHVDIGVKDRWGWRFGRIAGIELITVTHMSCFSSRTGRRVDGRHPRRQPGPKIPDPILEGNPASPLASPVNDISDELSAEIDLEWLKYAD